MNDSLTDNFKSRDASASKNDYLKPNCYFPADIYGGGEALPEADGGALQISLSADSY